MGKLRSFSLFESVVAVSVIAILIAIATMVYGNVMTSEKPIPFYQGKSEIDEMLNTLKIEGLYENQSKDFEQYTIEQEVKPYLSSKNTLLVEYRIKAGSKTWWQEKHIVSREKAL